MPRKSGVPNKVTAKVKDKLSDIVNDALDSLDIENFSRAEKLKLIQIGVQYIIPRLKQVEEVTDEMPTNFQIEVITSRSQLSEKELDKVLTD